MLLDFEPISLDRQIAYGKRFSACSQKASDYSFVNLWGWAEEYGLFWAWTDDLVWIKQTRPRLAYWAPVGAWEGIDWPACFRQYASDETLFVRVPENLLQCWKRNMEKRLAIEDARGHWDYLYSLTDLVELKGNRLHKKRNLLSQFKKKYDFTYASFGKEMIELAKAMQEEWCTWRDCESSESLSAENNAILRILNNSQRLEGLSGGAIMVEDKMAAYTVAETMSEDTLLIHFEKGDPAFKGVYQAINHMFLEHSTGNFKIVNREQDLDNEGLRKAKLSYQPFDFVKKYQVHLLPA
ncbi:MAG: DUF2156 domain-containing protein [Deltaproteobacteria bacterium]|nr:DUF2156 domain-containing protein [Deltaproteobacteria bacterium]